MSQLKRHVSHPVVKSGDLYFNNNKYLEAIKYYDKAIQMDKNNLEALMGKGLALREIGKYMEAILCFNQYIELSKENYQRFDGFSEKGDTYICLGAYSDASECFDKCLEIEKITSVILNAKSIIYNAKGLVHSSMENFREAIRLYDKAIGARRDKELAYVLANKGNAWYNLEMYDEALESYTRALSLNNNETNALIGKAKYYKKWGKDEDAEKLYKDALKIDPNFVALSAMSEGISLHFDSKCDKAIQVYDEIIALTSMYSISPQYISLIYINKGLALYSIEMYNEAINSFDVAIDTDSTYCVLALIGKGASQEKLLDPHLAINSYNEALKLDENLEIASINDIIYMYADDKYTREQAFFPPYNNNLLSRIIINMKSKQANTKTIHKIDSDLEDIGLNGYHEIEISQERIQEIKRYVFEVGIAGEEFINAYLQFLYENGKIKQFEWASKKNAISPYDFYIINYNDERINLDVKSTNGEFDRRFHISYGELKRIFSGPERYDIYRVYELNTANAKLRIATDIRSFASGILEILKGLPEGVVPDGVSVDTSLLKFEPEIVIHK